MSERILITDDDRFLTDTVSRLLSGHGYEVASVSNGEDCLIRCKTSPPDLLVLDLGLPDQDGIHVCRQLRQRGSFPILMLTSRADSVDKVIGLEVGADDYITKPFDAHELLARVKALLRRSKGMAGSVETARVGRLEINRAARTVRIDGTDIPVTETEYRIVDYLAANAGRAISREQLFETVWGYELEFSSNSLEVLIYRLRGKLAALGEGGLIKTVRGYGYKIAAD